MASSNRVARAAGGFRDDLAENWRVYWLAAVASCGGLLFGWDTGLIGGVLTTKSFQNDFGLAGKENEQALADLKGNIVSSLQAGCFLGALFGMVLPNKIGRKTTILIAGSIFLIGSIIQTVCRLGSQSAGSALGQLYAGRVIGGIGVGLTSAVVPSYIAESVPARIRGRCTSMYQLLNVTGVALSFWVNYGLSVSGRDPLDRAIWQIPFALQCLPGAMLMVGMFFQPESPRFLAEFRNDPQAAALALARVHRKSPSSPEIQLIIAEMQEEMIKTRQLQKETGTEGFFGQFKAAFCTNKKTTYRAVVVPCVAMIVQQLSGTNSINYYAPSIFKSLGITGSSSSLFATGVYGIVKIVTTALFLMFALEQLGRKWCLIIGGLGQAFALYWIAIFLGIRPTGVPLDGWSYVTVAMIYIYVAFYGLGWSGPVWTLSSEIAPTHLRSFTLSLASATQWTFNCIIARVTPNMLLTLKFGTFIFFGTSVAIGCAWAAFLLPETSRWPLERIDLIFEGNLVKRSVQDLHIKRRNQHRERVLAELAEQTQAEFGVIENPVPTLAASGSDSDHGKDSKSDDKH